MVKKKIKLFDIREQQKLIKKDTTYSIRQQCKILEINRASLYYKKKENSVNMTIIMNLISMEYENVPFYGVRRIQEYLNRLGYNIGKYKIRTLLKELGLQAIYPRAKPNTSIANSSHKKYPYLLKDIEIIKCNQVWSTDITYIKLPTGTCYLTAIIDVYSRAILSWKLSNTLTTDFCIEALEEAISMYGKPEIFNSDQGSQYTSNVFIEKLKANNIQISMDGKGRYLDNIIIERFWRSLKYENIYIQDYQNMKEAREGLKKYFEFYNNDRYHQSLNYKTPQEVYASSLKQNLVLN